MAPRPKHQRRIMTRKNDKGIKRPGKKQPSPGKKK